MNNPEIADLLFREAVDAIDAGDINKLQHLLVEHPMLAHDRLEFPDAWLRDRIGNALDGFFRRPCLLWFVAEDPVRNGELPGNIAGVTSTIIQAAEREGMKSLQEQLDYALLLVAWSWVARKCDVQIELIDVLVDAGASPEGVPNNALVNGNFAAAERLVERGAKLTLPTALCLGRWNDVTHLAQTASTGQKQFSLILASLNGKAAALTRLISLGVDINIPSTDLYSHATALHHAVYSGSLDAVKVLVEAGAALGIRDTIYNGTPLGWAEYGQHAEIAAYLREKGGQG